MKRLHNSHPHLGLAGLVVVLGCKAREVQRVARHQDAELREAPRL